MKSAAVGAIALGLFLLMASGLWTTLFPGTSSWTPEKGTRWGQVKDRLNALSFIVHRPPGKMHSGPDWGPLKAEYDQLQREHEQLKAEFESASSRPNTIAAALKWTGISLAAIGLFGWYIVKGSS
jgi:hypothetical protein